MPLDGMGCTRATLVPSASSCPDLDGSGNRCNVYRDRDGRLQRLTFNDEPLVRVSHQPALITSLPFVHTTRRSNRLNGTVNDVGLQHETTSVLCGGSSNEPYHLEEGELVTRSQ